MPDINRLNARLIGVELYFSDLHKGKQFYGDVLGLDVQDEEEGHHVQFDAGGSFVCLERKGSESYASRDKAVVFLEVPDLAEAIGSIGQEKIVATGGRGESRRRAWAALHDPEGYNIVLVEAWADPAIGRDAN